MNDKIDDALKENVRRGYIVKAGKNAKGEQLYRLTKDGERRVEWMLRREQAKAASRGDE